LRALTAEVRQLLPDAKLGYAADWSEYFGYHPQDGTGDVFFHLDPLWADPEIDFVGIDNYMPLADWRDGSDHADADWGSVHNIDYLKANVAGGEGYDWYYPSSEARAAQIRVPITDGAGGTPWIYRYKDLRNWWGNSHVERRHPRDRSILAGGAAPSVWGAVGGAVVTPSGETLGLYDAAARIASGGAASDRAAVPGQAELLADQQYEVRILWRSGGSGRIAVVIAHPAGDTVITSDASPAVTAGPASIQSIEDTDAGDGARLLRLVLRWDTAGAVSVSAGPDSASSGEDVLVFAIDIAPWPVPATAWVPGSKPIWFTEFGCPAIDKGANQPNVFWDPKSSESARPYFSNGRRDDVMQIQAIRALTQYWSDPDNNPVSDLYGGPMVDTAHLFAWAWDTRPYPAFPTDQARWSDGGNFAFGHWLSGRISGSSLDLVVAEICRDAGLSDIDVSQLRGVVRGHVTAAVDTARARLQPLMLAYDFTAVERDGKIIFHHMPLRPEADIADAEIVVDEEEGSAAISRTRAPDAETVGWARVSYTEADGAFDTRVAEARFPDSDEITTSHSEVPLSLTAAEARDIAERWLASARVARDSVKMVVAPSRRDVAAGALVSLDDASLWRVDRVEDRGSRAVEATRVEPSLREPVAVADEPVAAVPYLPPAPIDPVFLDLPLLTGDEVAHAPHLAVAARPWPGPVAVYASPSDSNYTLNRVIDAGSAIGLLETPLPAATAGRWDRGPAVRVRIVGEALSSASFEDVLNGANVAAIGTGDEGPWEVLQFSQATLLAPDLWEISLRLRGQAGTEAVMPATWPAGAYFVLIDGRPVQLDLAASARGLARHWRIGPARRSLEDASYVGRHLAFYGVGLRPYAPTHLRVRTETAARSFSWVRRTRIDGDSWQGTDVPLGEDAEAYLVRVFDAGGLRREVTVTAPSWSYGDADRAADGTAFPFTVEVAQISARFGPGPAIRIEIDD
ncbi:MAG: glycoside hydrolase TIM-barrel-like domain-containing protein, partial [Pseudomonadota bacterium]